MPFRIWGEVSGTARRRWKVGHVRSGTDPPGQATGLAPPRNTPAISLAFKVAESPQYGYDGLHRGLRPVHHQLGA